MLHEFSERKTHENSCKTHLSVTAYCGPIQNQAADERQGMGNTDDNARVLLSQMDSKKKNSFLEDNQQHILNLARTVAKRHITTSDDEWSAAMLAVSQAIDEYREDRGDFWPFAAVVIKSRLLDLGRKEARRDAEISVQPAAFDGEVDEDDANLSSQMEVREAAASMIDLSLKEEIEAAGKEFSRYGFSFFDLAYSSPRSFLTRAGCAKAVRAIFTPPPLTDDLKRTKTLPVKAIIERTGQSRKLLDKYRRYLIAAALILSDDYPGLQEYFRYMKTEKKT